MEILFRSQPYCNAVIAIIFCTWRATSTAVIYVNDFPSNPIYDENIASEKAPGPSQSNEMH